MRVKETFKKVRVLSERMCEGPEAQERGRDRVAEFSVPTWQVLIIILFIETSKFLAGPMGQLSKLYL